MITPEFKLEIGGVFGAWILLYITKVIPLLPQLQVVAVCLAILSTCITLVLNIPKIVELIKSAIYGTKKR